ncbi:MAG: prolyl oligopeptidase family serine peptidase [Balneolales bacterium]
MSQHDNTEPEIRKSDISAMDRRHFLNYAATMTVGVGFIPSCLASSSSGDEKQLPRLDRDNLLIYLDDDGIIQPVKTRDDWLRRRAMILDSAQEVMGPLPKGRENPPDYEIERETDEGPYIQRLISYTADEGERVPAYLLIPKEALEEGVQFPAVISPLGTGMSATAFGKAALEQDGLPRWNDGRDYAWELVKRGYVTLVPAYPHLGEYRPDIKGLGYQSGTMKAIWDNIRGLDLLDQLPFVRSGRYGAIGHSLGGHNSIYTALFDERIKVIVSSCGFDSYLDYMDGDISGWTQERYMPKLGDYALEEIPFDFHEMLAVLATRACFVNAPMGDLNFKWKSAASVVNAAMQIYNLYGVPERLRIEHPDAGHSFPDQQREQAYHFLDQYLS